LILLLNLPSKAWDRLERPWKSMILLLSLLNVVSTRAKKGLRKVRKALKKYDLTSKLARTKARKV
jgi:hypothetical protein